MRKALLVTFVLGALTSVACAADLPGNPPSAFNWTGPYGGVEAGFGFPDTTGTSNVRRLLEDFSSSPTVGLLGGVIGYNYQIDRVVFGLEGDVGGVLGGDHTVATSGGLGSSATTSSSYYADIRGRLGYAVDRALFYVAGGVAFGDQKTVYSNPKASFTSNRTGWTLGGGLDYGFTKNWIGRVEYRYTDLGSSDYSFGLGAHDRVHTDSNAVLLGLVYKFGG